LDADATAVFIRNARATSRRLAGLDDEVVLRRKGVLEVNGNRLTLGGLYALGQYPQQFAPSLAITAAVVTPPGSADRLVDLTHFDGPIPDLLEGCLEWLRRNLRTSIRVGVDGNSYDHMELPLPALREFVANALVHRDLGPNTQSKRVEIRLREDRLVISNPGGLWGVSRQQLGMPGGKSAVNEHLYDICTFLQTSQGARIIEGEGGGISEAQNALADWPADPPIFIDKAVSFTTVLMRPHTTADPNPASGITGTWTDTPSGIIAALSQGPLDKRAIAERCRLTPSQTRYALKRLIAAGEITMNGGLGARNTTYTLNTP
jgi:ATP-dependent DNA helicase RecG